MWSIRTKQIQEWFQEHQGEDKLLEWPFQPKHWDFVGCLCAQDGSVGFQAVTKICEEETNEC